MNSHVLLLLIAHENNKYMMIQKLQDIIDKEGSASYA